MGAIGLVVGPLLAWLSGSCASLIVAGVLAAVILAYDAGLKRTVLGPEVMGACRGLEPAAGYDPCPGSGWTRYLAGGRRCTVCSCAGITWISRSETESGRTRTLLVGFDGAETWP